MENDEVKKIRIKDRTCFYFDDIMKLKDFDIDNPIGIRRRSCVSFRSQIVLTSRTMLTSHHDVATDT